MLRHKDQNNRHEPAFEMLQKLRSYALPELYCQVVVCKVVFDWSLQDIAEELGIPHRQTVHYIWQEALKLLKERNYRGGVTE